LLSQDYATKITIVDFGSSPENIEWERKLFTGEFINFIEVTRETKHFNKSRALNIAIRNIATPYVISTDIDCIFELNFVKEVMNVLKTGNKIVLCQKYDLCPDGFVIGMHEPSAVGSCIGLTRDWLLKVHGYDETYTYWGREDNDLVDRAKEDGLQEAWITGKTKIYHQWHTAPNVSTLTENVMYFGVPSKPLVRNRRTWGEL
jgi:GT2 family glycosyltransferase